MRKVSHCFETVLLISWFLLQILGGIDESLYTGTITYVPIYKEWYYEVVITDIDVGDASLEMDCKEVSYLFISFFILNSAEAEYLSLMSPF